MTVDCVSRRGLWLANAHQKRNVAEAITAVPAVFSGGGPVGARHQARLNAIGVDADRQLDHSAGGAITELLTALPPSCGHLAAIRSPKNLKKFRISPRRGVSALARSKLSAVQVPVDR
jgi:hypothetical protein